MRYLVGVGFVALITLIGACTSSPEEERLPEGAWSGGLVPMNHPDLMTPLTYAVRYREGRLLIDIDGAGPTRDARLEGDTLRFGFTEPEEGVPLDCALGRQADGRLIGRCTAPDGQWARFTMIPPQP